MMSEPLTTALIISLCDITSAILHLRGVCEFETLYSAGFITNII